MTSVGNGFASPAYAHAIRISGHMQKSGIPVPLHIIVDRDSLKGDEKDPAGFVETEDFVELNGMARYANVSCTQGL